jgi:hypothetical protein
VSITTYDCQVAEKIFDDSGMGQLLRDALRADPRGRKLRLDPSAFLKAMYLCASQNATTYLKALHTTLTEEIPEPYRFAWGVHYYEAGELRTISYDDIKNMSRRMRDLLDYSEARFPDLPPECVCENPPETGDCSAPGCQGQDRSAERKRRKDAVQAIINAGISATLITRPPGSMDYAIDSTGLWAHERAKGAAPKIDEESDEMSDHDVAASESDPQALPSSGEPPATPEPSPVGRRRTPSDADWGVKTTKSGARRSFFGHEAHAVVRVPDQHPDGKTLMEPALLEALRITPASVDIIEPTLAMIDEITANGQRIRYVIVDRHYSYKRFDRWLLKLTERGITQVIDLRENEQGFRSWDGIPFAASWAHCPGTPEHLGVIPTLSPNATRNQTAEFTALIEERWAYAAQRSAILTRDGKCRFRCPALAGKIGCALVPGSEQVAINLGLPVVANPPSPESAPALCTQKTWGAHIQTAEHERIMKNYQEFYWGSASQRRLFGRRTFVEQWFSILKAPNSAGKNRESSLHTGLAMVSIEIGIFAIIANLIRLRAWHRDTIAAAQASAPGVRSLGIQGPGASLLLRQLKPGQSGIPMDEEEWLQRLAEARSQIQALTADEESDSDAA